MCLFGSQNLINDASFVLKNGLFSCKKGHFPNRLDSNPMMELQLSHSHECRTVSGQGFPRPRFPQETRVVTKKEIVKQISEEIGLTQLKTKEIVQKTFDAIIETLVEERRIELRNFGVFEVKKRAARKARNPRTGERVDVAEKFVVTFKPGKEMEEKVLELDRKEAARLERESQAQSSEYVAGSQPTTPTLHTTPTPAVPAAETQSHMTSSHSPG